MLAGRGCHFIGSHPMAGSEKTGLEAATAGLFAGTACLLTNDNSAPEPLTRKLERFWQDLGCRTSWWTAAAHDTLMARISHLPHILAAHAALVCIPEADLAARHCGNGLRDTTRVAAGDPAMWADIVIANRDALAAPLREAVAGLNELVGLLDAANPEAVRAWLAAAKSRRDMIQ
jgi:prephenate dehydrogenase